MHAAIAKAWSVGNRCGRQTATLVLTALAGDRQRFAQGLDTIEHTSCCATLDGNTLLVDVQYITFLSGYLWRYGQLDVAHLLSTLVHDGQVALGQLLDVLLQEFCFALQFGRGQNLYVGVNLKGCTFCHHNRLWQWYHVVVGRLASRSCH